MNYSLLADHKGVRSVYSYTLRDIQIPVLIVEDSVDRYGLQDGEIWKNYPGLIVLTEDDLARGNDVYALTFVHMLLRGKLEAGDDMIGKLSLSKEHILWQAETTLRSFCIDLRESIFQGAKIADHYPQIELLLDRIWCGLWYLEHKGDEIPSVEALATYCVKHVGVVAGRLMEALTMKPGAIAWQTVHADLLALQQKIDSMRK